MKSILNKIDDEKLEACPHYAFKPLVYCMSFFHAIVQDRRKYAKIGWNCKYAFNESDINISINIMQIYLQKTLDNKEDSLPWETLRYLIGQAMYGGRVTDSYDRICLVTYLDEYMGDFLFDKNRPFFFAKTG
jgi:dynein heavy chain